MDYPIDLQAIINWFAGKADSLARTGVRLIETASRNENLPAAHADFDSTARSDESVSGLQEKSILKSLMVRMESLLVSARNCRIATLFSVGQGIRRVHGSHDRH
jgi:hypothetical protein